ncbi:unnamed protein product, partial [Meganyctiphanes norvegica]
TVISFVIILIIVMVLAIGGNILVLATLARHRGMRTRTNVLLANLSVADIIVAVTDIPFAIYTLINGTWPLSHSLCILNAFFVGLGLMVSVQTLMWISVHKFISITWPFSTIITKSKIILMIILAWGWCIFYNLTPIIGLTDIIYRRGASQCGPTTPITMLQRSHSITNTVFNIFLPFTVMSYCYYRIFGQVRTHMDRLREFADVDVRHSIVQQKQITVTLFIVLSCFVFCWSPYILYSNLIVFRGKEGLPVISNPIAYLFGYMNSACNPIIYALRSLSFRQGFGEIICGHGQMTEARKVYAAHEIKGAATINELQKGQHFTSKTSLGTGKIIKNLSTYEENIHNAPKREANNLATIKKLNESVLNIANTSSYDLNSEKIKASSDLSIYDNYTKKKDELFAASAEIDHVKKTNKTEINKEIELMYISSILYSTHLNHSGSLPEILAESHRKLKSLKYKKWKNLDTNCINKYVPYQNVLLYSASVGDLSNEKCSFKSIHSRFSVTHALVAASIEDLIEVNFKHQQIHKNHFNGRNINYPCDDSNSENNN